MLASQRHSAHWPSLEKGVDLLPPTIAMPMSAPFPAIEPGATAFGNATFSLASCKRSVGAIQWRLWLGDANALSR